MTSSSAQHKRKGPYGEAKKLKLTGRSKINQSKTLSNREFDLGVFARLDVLPTCPTLQLVLHTKFPILFYFFTSSFFFAFSRLLV